MTATSTNDAQDPDARRKPSLSEEDNRMTTVQDNPVATTPVAAAPAKITKDIQQRVVAIGDEMNRVIKDRKNVIHGALVAVVGQLHLLMLGPGGTGKSFLVRDLVSHIQDARHFETALDETTDPGQVFGPPDIKAMVDDGKTRRVTTGMLPEAEIAFIDEIFNGNAPVLHSLMPILNERVFHNNGIPGQTPLRAAFAGTNKLNADADLAAFFDRLHLRYTVDYVASRDHQSDMVAQAITRMAENGRGTSTSIIGETRTMVTVDELDQAHTEALALDMPEPVLDLFLDIRDELKGNGIQISDRRMVEGMAAVLANAWIRGHETVTTGDLDILSAMWWTIQDQQTTARGIILAATNPGEKAALDLLEDLDKFRAEVKGAKDMDDDRKRRVGVETIRNADKLLADAAIILAEANRTGADTTRINEVIVKTNDFKMHVGKEIFNIDPEAMGAMRQADGK